MRLYSMVPQDCSGKVRWLLRELGVSFDDIKLSYEAGDLKSEAFLAKQPLGQVPVLEDESVSIFESHAIVMYLADKYIERGFAPAYFDLQARAAYYQWSFFCTSSAENFFLKIQRLPEMAARNEKEWCEYVHDKTMKVMSAIEMQLANRDYILGAFSAVDVSLGYALDRICLEPFFQDFPRSVRYLQRLASREACIKSEIFKRK